MNRAKMSRRGFIKAAGLAAGTVALWRPVTTLAATDKTGKADFVGARQKSVYQADAEIYKIRKSQDNPMVKKLYDQKTGFLHGGPCGHMSHHLLHTHYVDRSSRIKALKEKGFQLNL